MRTAHYHGERNHQGIGNELIEARDLGSSGEIHCCERLGGLLKYYYRAPKTGSRRRRGRLVEPDCPAACLLLADDPYQGARSAGPLFGPYGRALRFQQAQV